MPIFKSIYLFIYLAALGLSFIMRDLCCNIWDLFIAACGLFVVMRGLLSSCGTWAPEHPGSVVAACGLSSCDMWALEPVGSVVVACRLSCPMACGILVPQPGIEPVSPALVGGFLTTGPPGKSLSSFISDFIYLGPLKGP